MRSRKVLRGTPDHSRSITRDKGKRWEIERRMGRFGTNYACRASWTYWGLGGNLAEDAIYPTVKEDNEGRPLEGDQ
jgi:hypothetical protein